MNYDKIKNKTSESIKALGLAALVFSATGCAVTRDYLTGDPTERNTKYMESIEKEREFNKRIGYGDKSFGDFDLRIY